MTAVVLIAAVLGDRGLSRRHLRGGGWGAGIALWGNLMAGVVLPVLVLLISWGERKDARLSTFCGARGLRPRRYRREDRNIEKQKKLEKSS